MLKIRLKLVILFIVLVGCGLVNNYTSLSSVATTKQAVMQLSNWQPSVLDLSNNSTNQWWQIDNHVLTILPGKINLNAQNAAAWPWDNQRAQITKVIIQPTVIAQRSILDMFAHMPQLTQIEGLENLDTSAVTNMSGMFLDDLALTQVDVSHFQMQNVTSVAFIFQNCTQIPILDISNWNMKIDIDTQAMFAGMMNLWQLKLGEQTNFNANPQLPKAPGDDRLMPSGTNFNHNHKWQDVGSGQPDNPQGKWFETENLIAAYSTHQPHISKTFVWDQSWWDVDFPSKTLTIYKQDLNSTAVDQTYWPWQAQYHQDIKKVIINPGFHLSGSFCGLFSGLEKVEQYVGLDNLDTSQATDMSYMFYGNLRVTKLDVSNFKTNHVQNFAQMFNHTDSLTKLDVSNFDTSQGRNMAEMFENMAELRRLDLRNFNMRQVQNTTSMLNHNKNLWQITLGKAVYFPTDPGLQPAPGAQTPIPDHPNFLNENRNWQEVSLGTILQPQGKQVSPTDIWSAYLATNNSEQTYVWTSHSSGYLTLAEVPNALDFGQHKLPMKQQQYYTQSMQDFHVIDTRRARDQSPAWQLKAYASPLISCSDPHQMIMGTPFTYRQVSFDEAEPIILHQQLSNLQQTDYFWSYRPINGIYLDLRPHSVPQTGRYQATITYELQDSL